MLQSMKKLIGHSLHASDGDIGKAIDFFFDDDTWTVRYLVADSGGWLSGRTVLISPMAIRHADWEAGHIDVALTMSQVGDSPSIETDLPVGQRLEGEYYRYYGWPNYWEGGGLWGPHATPSAAAAMTAAYPPPPNVADTGDAHLRSVREVRGYRLQANDGEIGNVEDFLLDDESWSIGQIVIDTTRWWFGGEVMIAPQHIKEVDWTTRTLSVDLTREAIKTSPQFDYGSCGHRSQRSISSSLCHF